MPSSLGSRLRFAALALIGGATISACASAPVRPPDSARALGDSAAVIAVVDGFIKALSDEGGKSALRFLSEDAYVLEGGVVESKAQYAAGHLSRDVAFAKAVATGRGPLKVIVDGNVAWTVSSNAAQGQINGRSVDSDEAELIVLSRAGGTWLIRAIHWSTQPRPSP